MLVYVLSNKDTNTTLGVFSTLFEAQKYYTLHENSNVKLEKFILDKNINTFFDENINFKQKKKIIHEFRPLHLLDTIYECDNCGGEDCVINNECCNSNYY